MAEQLRTPEEMAAYLDAWLSDYPEDSAGIARALGDTRARKAWRTRQPRPRCAAQAVAIAHKRRLIHL